MAIQNDRPRSGIEDRSRQPEQPATGGHEHVKNPFREADVEPREASPEEEAAAEQQRKEALTERD